MLYLLLQSMGTCHTMLNLILVGIRVFFRGGGGGDFVPPFEHFIFIYIL